LRENLQDDKHVFVPRIFWEQTSRRVLTMERSFGKKLTHIPSSEQESRRRVAQALMASFLKQVFEDGFFHGDPHPGNVFLLEDG
ncbi:AarF/UbiB family protein, partial [Escherichia coli]